MKRTTGLGGLFFKCKDPATMRSWYRKHLGIDSEDWGFSFLWRELDRPEKRGYTVWNPFPETTNYFAPSQKPLMMNFRVDDMDALLVELEKEGIELVGEPVTEENGKFAWIMDPEGHKIELWEPVDSSEDPYLPQDE